MCGTVTPMPDSGYEAGTEKGRELERARIRQELHGYVLDLEDDGYHEEALQLREWMRRVIDDGENPFDDAAAAETAKAVNALQQRIINLETNAHDLAKGNLQPFAQLRAELIRWTDTGKPSTTSPDMPADMPAGEILTRILSGMVHRISLLETTTSRAGVTQSYMSGVLERQDTQLKALSDRVAAVEAKTSDLGELRQGVVHRNELGALRDRIASMENFTAGGRSLAARVHRLELLAGKLMVAFDQEEDDDA